jgi:aminoglycoside phosphotransferase (APT) family kinase protein
VDTTGTGDPSKSDHPLSWLADGSVASLRAALATVAPTLADTEIRLNDRVVTDNAEFFQGSAVVGGAYLVKFAWSEAPARRLVHEAAVLTVLGSQEPPLPVPEVVASSSAPAILVTQRVAGQAVGQARFADLARRQLADDLGRFLAALHRPGVLHAALAAGVAALRPEPQASTDSIRIGFPKLVGPEHVREMRRLCDFADEVLLDPGGSSLLHGDLHVFNLVCTPGSGRLCLVADFEQASVGDPAFDFRYLPGPMTSPAFLDEVMASYEAAAGTTVDLRRVLAWHVRTVLGDALWRSEAGVPLPGGGTPSSWVNDLEDCFERLLGR